MLKRALLTAALVFLWRGGIWRLAQVGPVVIPEAGDVVVINHGPDMTLLHG